jgi:branched-chain amino acid transport system ATP-binding protein
MTRPKIVLIDEPAAALAPIAAEEVYREIEKLKDEGITVVLVDQNVKKAISIADYVYILKFGRIAQEAPSEQFMENLEDLISEWL